MVAEPIALLGVVLFFHHINDLEHLLLNALVIFPLVGTQATGAVLDPVFGVCKPTSATISEGIKRAIAKQAAKFLRICTLMAGEVFTLFMLKKFVVFHVYISFIF